MVRIWAGRCSSHLLSISWFHYSLNEKISARDDTANACPVFEAIILFRVGVVVLF